MGRRMRASLESIARLVRRQTLLARQPAGDPDPRRQWVTDRGGRPPYSQRGWCLVTGALTILGCVSSQEDAFRQASPSENTEGALPSETLESILDATCLPGRYVAQLLSEGPCPPVDPSRWDSYPLFAEHTAWLEEHPLSDGEVPPALGRYCVYEAIDGDADAPSHPMFAAVGPDCALTTPEAPLAQTKDSIFLAVRDDLQAAFDVVTGRLSGAELLNLHRSQVGRPVHVAVVDTWPTHEPSQTRSDHGRNMVALIEDLTGANLPGTSITVAPVLGLPRDRTGARDLIHGGLGGTQIDVAAAFWEAYRRWKLDGSAQALVISASLGFDPRITGRGPAEEALYDVIRSVRCAGAMVVAATGNKAFSCAEDALAPARFELQDVPPDDVCEDLYGARAGTEGEPLVVAVGGLDLEGRHAMPLSRPGAAPSLASAATLVTAPSMSTAGTGTSFATAVVSATAALVWSRLDLPDSDADVVDLLQKTGVEVDGWRVEFGPREGDPVRRVQLCAAVEAACARGRPCSLPCRDPDAPTMDWTSFYDHLATVPMVQATTPKDADAAYAHSGTVRDECELPLQVHSSDPTRDIDDVYADVANRPALRYTMPQPASIACPVCGISSFGWVTATMAPEYAQFALTHVVIELGGSSPTSFVEIDPNVLNSLRAGAATQFSLPSGTVVSPGQSASIVLNFPAFQRTSALASF